MNNNLNTIQKLNVLKKLAILMSNDENVNVEYGKNNSYTDGVNIVIGRNIVEKNFKKEKALNMHESLHIFCDSFKLMKDKIAEYLSKKHKINISAVKILVNIVEDARINLVSKELYIGYYNVLRKIYAEDLKKFLNKIYLPLEKNVDITINKIIKCLGKTSTARKLTLYFSIMINVLNDIKINRSNEHFMEFDKHFYDGIKKIRNDIKNDLSLFCIKNHVEKIIIMLKKRLNVFTEHEFAYKEKTCITASNNEKNNDLLDNLIKNIDGINTDEKAVKKLQEKHDKNLEEIENVKKIIKEIKNNKNEEKKHDLQEKHDENDDLNYGVEKDLFTEIFDMNDDSVSESSLNEKIIDIKKNNNNIKHNINDYRNVIDYKKEKNKELNDAYDVVKKEQNMEIKKKIEAKKEKLYDNEYHVKRKKKSYSIEVKNANDCSFKTNNHVHYDKIVNNNEIIIKDIQEMMQCIKNKKNENAGYSIGKKVHVRKYIKSKANNFKNKDFFIRDTKYEKIHITIVIDLSTSMKVKLKTCREVFFTFCESYKEIASVRIVGFSGRGSKVLISVFKDFNENIDVEKLNKLNLFKDYGVTPDGIVILEEAKLMKNINGKKLMIVISDGATCFDKYEIEDAIIDVEKARYIVPIFAFSIDCTGDHLYKMYENNFVNCTAHNFKEYMLTFTNLIISKML